MDTQAGVIFITGASAGIGAATARLFAQEGYRVVLAARRMDRLDALAQEIQTSGGQALAVAMDVMQPETVQQAVDTALRAYGQIDVLFNNAGLGRLDWIENITQDEAAAVVNTNVLGVIYVTQAVLPHMVARRQGHVIIMSSIAGLFATPRYSVYAASKFGVHGFTEALRREVRVHGVRVSGLYPGGTRTEFQATAGYVPLKNKTTPAFLRMEAGDVAKGVLSLVRRPRRSLVLPWVWQVAIWVDRLAPWLMDWAMEQRVTKPGKGL